MTKEPQAVTRMYDRIITLEKKVEQIEARLNMKDWVQYQDAGVIRSKPYIQEKETDE